MTRPVRKDVNGNAWELVQLLGSFEGAKRGKYGCHYEASETWNKYRKERTKGLGEGTAPVRKPFFNFHSKLISGIVELVEIRTKESKDQSEFIREAIHTLAAFTFQGSKLIDRHEIRNLYISAIGRLKKMPQAIQDNSVESTEEKPQDRRGRPRKLVSAATSGLR